MQIGAPSADRDIHAALLQPLALLRVVSYDSEMESLVLTVIGKDRPGLVESVAAAIAEHGGSWVESRMSRLAGQFAGILRATVDGSRVDALLRSLSALNDEGLRITVERGSTESDDERSTVLLELVGSDRPGIIATVSHVLAAQQVNVDELQTECDGAPWSGDTLFKATARLQVPKQLSLQALRESLEAIAGDLMVDITLGDVPES